MALNLCTAEIELLKFNKKKNNYQFNGRFSPRFLQYRAPPHPKKNTENFDRPKK